MNPPIWMYDECVFQIYLVHLSANEVKGKVNYLILNLGYKLAAYRLSNMTLEIFIFLFVISRVGNCLASDIWI